MLPLLIAFLFVKSFTGQIIYNMLKSKYQIKKGVNHHEKRPTFRAGD